MKIRGRRNERLQTKHSSVKKRNNFLLPKIKDSIILTLPSTGFSFTNLHMYRTLTKFNLKMTI